MSRWRFAYPTSFGDDVAHANSSLCFGLLSWVYGETHRVRGFMMNTYIADDGIVCAHSRTTETRWPHQSVVASDQRLCNMTSITLLVKDFTNLQIATRLTI